MSRPSQVVYPALQPRLAALGERIKLARMRRRVSQSEMAARLGVSRMTVIRLENGDPNVAVGVLARALRLLGLDADLDRLVAEDEVGQRLQDSRLPLRMRKARGA